MQNQPKLIKQTQENGQKLHFDPILTPFDPISGRDIFFENRASSLFSTHHPATLYVKSEKSYGGKYHNFCDGRTDGLTSMDS